MVVPRPQCLETPRGWLVYLPTLDAAARALA